MRVDSLVVEVNDRPFLSYVGGWISFQRSIIMISRLNNGGAISNNGAHLFLNVSSEIIKNCLNAEESVFLLEGPNVGQLDESYGLSNYEYGGFGEHAVRTIKIKGAVEATKQVFHLRLSGTLAPKKQSQENWQMPKPITSFCVDLTLPLSETGQAFSGEELEVQASIGKRLEASFDS